MLGGFVPGPAGSGLWAVVRWYTFLWGPWFVLGGVLFMAAGWFYLRSLPDRRSGWVFSMIGVQCSKRRSIMFTTLTDSSKAAIFTVVVLLLAVTVAASISLFSITSEFLSIVLYMFTPALTVLIMMLVVTRDGFSREGWRLLGLGRLGLKAWWIALLLPWP